MILDELLEFADAVSVAASAGTTLIGDVIDLGAAQRDIGNGEDVYLVITVDTDIVAAGAGTIRFQLVSDAQAAIAVDGSASVHINGEAIVTATTTPARLKAGRTIMAVQLPREGAAYERYLGILCAIATQTVSAGKINAFLTKDPAGWRAYADAVN